jgi:hypothetical protein
MIWYDMIWYVDIWGSLRFFKLGDEKLHATNGLFT